MWHTWKWFSLAIMLVSAVGCPASSRECDNGISTTQTNPHGRLCLEDCECNNQRFSGRCTDGRCGSIAREACFQKGHKRPCEAVGLKPVNEGCPWGVQVCQDQGLDLLNWGDCRFPSPAEKEDTREICTDGIDNDCSRRADFQADPSCKDFCKPGDARACYGKKGDESFPSFGVCRRGQQLCRDDNTWGDCVGAVSPSPEVCDKQDNDCDGQVDEDVAGCTPPPDCQKGQTQPCFTAPRGCVQVGAEVRCQGRCSPGLRTCSEQGRWSECVGQQGPAPFEDCNGIDDTCDGQVDEGCVCPKQGATQSCFLGPAKERNKGQCRDGLQICQRGFWGPCIGSSLARQEACNGLDDDCNGLVDEGCGCSPGQRQACFLGAAVARGKGVCQDGTQLCVLGVWGACEGSTPPTQEICDGLDNDCDGAVDEPEDLRAPACQEQQGVCRGSVKRCAGGAGWQDCNDADYLRHSAAFVASDGENSAHCDGLDNDCDGKVDELCAGNACKSGSVRICYTGPQNTQTNTPCREGIEACKEGKWSGQCLGQMVPRAEICGNSIDDDCNGKVDDGCEMPPPPGEDAGPVDAASEAQPELPSEIVPDTCADGARRPCQKPGLGVCSQGQELCTQGVWGACTLTHPQLSYELCDGLDNNCNGQIDEVTAAPPLEGLRPPPAACLKQKGTCQGATLGCRPSTYGAKWTGADALVKSGTEICQAQDYIAASIDYEDQPETRCDNLDNNCDGQIDENCPFLLVEDGGGELRAKLLRRDAAGNMYLLVDIVNLNNTTPIKVHNYSSTKHSKALPATDYDQLVIKVSASGQYLWVKDIASGGIRTNVISYDAVLDNTGTFLYIVGSYKDTLIIENQTLRTSDFNGGGNGGGGEDIFLLKLKTADGKLVWGANIGSLGDDRARSIAIDSAGALYVAIEYPQSMLFLTTHQRMEITSTIQLNTVPNPGASTDLPTQIAILKFVESTTTGTQKPKLEWIAKANSNAHINIVGIRFDASNTLRCLGHISNTGLNGFAPFDGAVFGNFKLLPKPNTRLLEDRTLFLATLNTTTKVWDSALSFGSTARSYGSRLAVQGSDIYVLGRLEGSETIALTGGNQTLQSWGGDDVLALKLDKITVTTGPSGAMAVATWAWATHWGTPHHDEGRELVPDSQGNVFVTGSMQKEMSPSSDVYFGPRPPGSAPPTLRNRTFLGQNGFVAKLNSAGAIVWGFVFAGNRMTEGTGLTIGGSNNTLWMAGWLDPAHNVGLLPLQFGSRTLSLTTTNKMFLWQLEACKTGSTTIDCVPP